ncbi:MAG: hypothetical protein HYR90_00560 [Candidatus Andersenbacteria bacterium]|nr:hypothetical protein [Candidatus Andersenbacteria bacterium]MBI3250722.1 hypothetical protein [Candidatus Andersenbacteria bacterium]
MKFLYRVFSHLLLATLLLPVHTLHAQQTPELSPSLFVRDIVASAENETISGSFRAISQSDNIVGGIYYQMAVLSTLPEAPEGELIADDPIIYSQEVVPANLSFQPKEEQVVNFSHALPTVPTGTYRFRVQLTTANGRDLGWWDQDVVLTSDSSGFIDLRPIAVLVDSVDPRVKLFDQQGSGDNNINEFYPELTDSLNPPEANRSEWGPLEGVNVDAGATAQLRADATNIGTGSLTGTITASVKRDLTTTTTAESKVLRAISLTPNQTETLTIPFTSPQAAGAYEIFLMVRDENNNLVSSIGEYRLVVRGPSASVISVLTQKLSVTKGDPIEFTVNIVGPADGETTIAGTAEVSLLDGATVVSSQSTAVQLAMEPITIEGSLVPDRDITGNPKLRVTLKDGTGNILDTYEVEFPRDGIAAASTSQATDPKGSSTKIIIAVGLALLLLLLGLFYRYRSPKTPIPPVATTTLLLILLVGGLFTTNQTGKANHEYTSNLAVGNYLKKTSDGGGTETFINSPMHNETFVGGQTISYSASSTFWNCNNTAHRYNYWNVNLATSGGKVSSHEQASSWNKVLAFPTVAFGKGKVTRTVSGTFTLSPSYPGNSTTMWNEIWWNGHGSYRLRSIMTWLNVSSPTPTATPTVTATPTPTPTATPTPTPTETTPVQSPSLVFTADPTSVPYGDKTTLQWSTTNTTSCWAEQGWTGWKNHLGGTELSAELTQTTTFSLECWNAVGVSSGKKFVTVQVTQPSEPMLVFTGDPLSVPIGGTSTLTWQATNATACTASLGWSGNKNNVSGTQVTAPLTQSTTYALSCQNAAGVSTGPKFVTITVIGGPPTPTPTPTPTPIDDGPFQEEE